MSSRKPIVTTRIGDAFFQQITEAQYQEAIAHNQQLDQEVRAVRLAELEEQRRSEEQVRTRKRDEQRRQEIANFRDVERSRFKGTSVQFDEFWPEILKEHLLGQMRGADPLEVKRRQMANLDDGL